VPWFRVDDGFASHPKTLATSLAARGLWVTAGSWSSAHLTDGVVPDHVLASLGGTPELADELVAAGLWRRVKAGWKFHDWHIRNPLKKEVLELRDKKAAAGRKGGLASGKARSKPEANHEAPASRLVEPPSRSHPGPKTVDVVNRTNGSSSRASPEVIEAIIREILDITGRHITPDWAQRVWSENFADRGAASPVAYVRQAIRNDPNPRLRFLPLY
jgi:hypothetical protein